MRVAMSVHTPVLLNEVLSLLEPAVGDALLIDATVGEGGHAEAFLRKFPGLTVYGVDADVSILEEARQRLRPFGDRVRLFQAWFTDFFRDYEQRLERRPERIFFDLGISMFHYERSGRGFAFKKEEALDMRIAGDGEPTAADIVNRCSEAELRRILLEYGEEGMAARIARRIVEERERSPITSTGALAELVRRAVPAQRRYGSIHPATRTFQALRIAVNRELERLQESLADAFRLLKPGGRLGVISFHSLEDRIVKGFFRERNKSCTCPANWPICQCGGKRELAILTKKPLSATAVELECNPASRSAKLRVAEKLSA